MLKLKNNLDERQELALKKIESRGCWIAFVGLLIMMIVQMIMYGFDTGRLAGEWIVFMVLSIYISEQCLKEGIWSRTMKPTLSSNVLVSVLSGVVVGIIMFFVEQRQFPDKIGGCIAAGFFSAAMVTALTLGALLLTAASYKKRIQKLEEEPEDEE